MRSVFKDLVVNNFGAYISGAKNKLTTIAIYNKTTSDYPGTYVARLFVGRKATPYIMLNEDLQKLRGNMPYGYTCLARDQKDDSVILETWI